MKILKNVICCNICGDVIESKDRHDIVWCSCQSCAVDGGHDYLRRCAKDLSVFTELSIVANDKDENVSSDEE